ncbi:MAG TPA: PrsW family intramembrane metalloprotease [Candidatus Dormibacteraeota bacterium]|nr:PrsW family intramembrane metalloprotease [Candidatus Dormibacteraeota bacterium]
MKQRGPDRRKGGTDRRKGAGRRAGESGVRPVEGHPLMACPHCGYTVPIGEFCGHCGAHLATGSTRRHHAFAAVPSEHVAHVSIVTTLFPHLPHRHGAPFRLALVAGGALVLILAALHLFAPATVVAVSVVPVLYLMYLYEVEVYESEPWLVIGATMIVGLVLGALLGIVAGGSLEHSMLTGDNVSGLGLSAIAIPIASQLLMLAGPLFLYVYRPRFGEPLDGLTFGAASALGFTLAHSLTIYWPLISGPLIAGGSTIDWAVRLTRSGLLISLINASTTAVVTSALWLRRYDRRRQGRPWHSGIAAALALAFGTQVFVGAIAFLLPDLIAEVAILTVLVLALLLYVRFAIHQALLVEGAEHEIGPDSTCPECHRVVPAMAFCPACGAARAAAPKHRRPRAPLKPARST